MKKYFIAFKPKGEFYAFLKSLSGMIEMLNPGITALYREELLHITLHKPVVGDYKEEFLGALNLLAQEYSNTRIVLSGLGIFHDNIVVRIQPTYHIAELWIKARYFSEDLSGEKGSDNDMLHVTLFKKVPDIENVKLFELVKNISLTGLEFTFEYICLFEKIENNPWVEIERLPLIKIS